MEARTTKGSRKQAEKKKQKVEAKSRLKKLNKEPQTKSKGIYLG